MVDLRRGRPGSGIRDPGSEVRCSYRPSSRVENAVRIEHPLHRRPEWPGVAERTPDVDLLFELPLRAQHDDVAEHVGARAEPFDDGPLDAAVGIDAQQGRADRGAANARDIRDA